MGLPRWLRSLIFRRYPVWLKRRHELGYWRQRKVEEDVLRNSHYETFFTTFFSLDRADYRDKRILDLGCGPRGSLEWATDASERVGLDPLARDYIALSGGQHGMRYVEGTAESIPFEGAFFDVVSSFNSIDHVESVDTAVREIGRVTRPGGLFLLLTEVNHDPTPTEPHDLDWSLPERFQSAFEVLEIREFEKSASGMYDSISAGKHYDHQDATRRYGILCAKFRRRTTPT